MLAENDPVATALFARYNSVRMPNLGLAEGEIAMLLAFLDGRRPSPTQSEPGRGLRTPGP
jgi:hypothetical protein